MSRRLLQATGGVVLALGAFACGEPDPPLANPFAKRVPRIRQLYLGQSLDHWLTRVADADPSVRSQAAWALGTLSGSLPQRAQALRPMLADPHPDVRFAAIVAAGRVPLTDEGSARILVTSFAAPALRRQARISAAQAGAAALDPLREALVAEDRMVRWSAAWALVRLGAAAEPLVPSLVERLRSDTDRLVRRQVAMAVGHAGVEGPRALAPLLNAPEAELRMLAERGLRNASPAAVPVLVELLTGSNPEHADFAAALFAHRVTLAEQAVAPLVSVLAGEGPFALDAADALVRVGASVRPVLEAARGAAAPALRDAIDDVLERLPKKENAKR